MTSYPAPPSMGVPDESTLGRRVAGRLIDSALAVLQTLLPYLMLAGLLISPSAPSDPYAPYAQAPAAGAMAAWLGGIALVVLAGLVASLWAFFGRGVGLGAAFLGLESIDPTTGNVSLGRSLYKYLLQWLLSAFTLGIAELIVSYVTYSRNDDRTWFDRTAGVVVRRRRPLEPIPDPEQVAAPGSAPVISDISLVGPGSIASGVGHSPWGMYATDPPPSDMYSPAARFGAPHQPGPGPSQTGPSSYQPGPGLHPPVPDPLQPPSPSPSGSSPWNPVSAGTDEARRLRPDTTPEKPVDQFNPYALRSGDDPAPAASPGRPANSPVEQVGAAEVAGGFVASTAFASDQGTPERAESTPYPPGAPTPMPKARPAARERSFAPERSAPPVDSETTVLAPEVLATAGTDAPSRPARLLLSTGESIIVTGPVVMGRNPGAPPDVPKAEPRVIEDPMRSLSKTHLAVGPAESGVWVIDLHSTNGVSVARARDEQLSGITPGERTTVPLGGRIRFGSYEAEVLS